MRSFFTKKNTQVDIFAARTERLGRYIKQAGSISDEMYERLLAAHVPVIVRHEKIDAFKSVIDSVLKDEQFGQCMKMAIYLTTCALVAETLVFSRSGFGMKEGQWSIPDLEKAGIFFHLISTNESGYEWVLNQKTLLSEMWLLFRSERGKFIDHVALYRTFEREAEVSEKSAKNDNIVVSESKHEESEADLNFTESDKSEIDDLFSQSDGEVSDDELLDLVSDSEDETEDGSGGDEPFSDEKDTDGVENEDDVPDPMKYFN